MNYAKLYILLGLYGCIGEILIGTLFSLSGRQLWLYYNGFYTSIESFFLFGFAGCIGLRFYTTFMKWRQAT